MTGNTLEQRARELLAEACGADQSEIADALKFPNHPDNMVTVPDALRAIEAALRLSAGADWVLVPREPTVGMVQSAVDREVDEDENLYVGIYRAMLAAAPRHEPGEG